MIVVSVKADITAAMRKLREIEQRQVPFATALALTRAAQFAKRTLVEEMRRDFRNPTPFTLNSLRVDAATKSDLRSKIYFKDFAGSGTPASKYLAPEIFGGARSAKGFERSLQRVGILPSGWFAVPADGAPFDQYGNVPAGVLVKILSQLQAFGEQGYSMNETAAQRAKRRRRPEGRYFAVLPNDPPSNKLKPGIYEKLDHSLSMIFIFTPKDPTYRARYPFFQVGEDAARSQFGVEFPKALEQALATAR